MKKAINYMKGELELMPKQKVVNVYYNLLKVNKIKISKTEINKLEKNQIIRSYVNLRNNYLLG